MLSLIHISEPTRRTPISYAVFCLKKKMAMSPSFTVHCGQHDTKYVTFELLRLFLTRNIFDKYLGCLGPKYLSKIFLENITWERWEASYGSEIFFSGFDGGM